MKRSNEKMHLDVDVAGCLLGVVDQVRGSLLFKCFEAFFLMGGWV